MDKKSFGTKEEECIKSWKEVGFLLLLDWKGKKFQRTCECNASPKTREANYGKNCFGSDAREGIRNQKKRQ